LITRPSSGRQRLLVKRGLGDESAVERGKPRDVGLFKFRSDQIDDCTIAVYPMQNSLACPANVAAVSPSTRMQEHKLVACPFTGVRVRSA
jgi:hypothetical protein